MEPGRTIIGVDIGGTKVAAALLRGRLPEPGARTHAEVETPAVLERFTAATDGSSSAACLRGIEESLARLVASAGKVDAIGLGGCDRYVYVGDRRYSFRQIDQFARLAKTTPVVDGSGVKNTLERKTIHYLQDNAILDFKGRKVLVVCSVDRFGMAQTIAGLIANFRRS